MFSVDNFIAIIILQQKSREIILKIQFSTGFDNSRISEFNFPEWIEWHYGRNKRTEKSIDIFNST